jgi:cbb3-type cytochrome oxidase subunit 3
VTLTDVMSNSGLAGYAVVAMILFMAVFVAIVLRIFAPWRKREMDEASRLPLDDGDDARARPGVRR